MRRLFPLAFAVGTLAGAARAEAPTWEFAEGQAPLRYEASLEHDESGNDNDRISLDLTLQLDLREKSPEGEGTFEITVVGVKVERNVAGRRHAFDSAKGKSAPQPVAAFADFSGGTITATVARGGEVKSVGGALARVPGPGDFLAEGADRDKLLADALVAEVVVKLFRLPGAAGYRCGVICLLGKAVAGCHLTEKTEPKQESSTRHGGAPCVRRTWTETLESEGGTLRSGGATLALRKGEAGAGRGEGIYAPGYPVSIKDTVEYEMPTAARTAKFKRSLEITLAAR
ncbi:MAG TPA: hypothetical protein VFY93_07330 [Planctomycetota bacterium]|nr:hypothetical protein [Planctomycetota bacterium]